MISTPTGKRFFQNIAGFCRDAAAGRVTPTGHLTWFGHRLLSTREIPLEEVSEVDDDRVDVRIKTAAGWRVRDEEVLMKEWRSRAKL